MEKKFTNCVTKKRDKDGNTVIQASVQYRIIKNKSLLATGTLCKIKMCQDIESGKYFAIKRFNKLRLRKEK